MNTARLVPIALVRSAPPPTKPHDSGWRHAVSSSQGEAALGRGEDFGALGVRKFGPMVPLPAMRGAMPLAVGCVLSGRRPTQVGRAVVVLPTVPVRDVLLFGQRRGQEGAGDEPVNVECLHHVSERQSDCRIAAHQAEAKFALSPGMPHAPEVGHQVPRSALDFAPFFSVGHSRNTTRKAPLKQRTSFAGGWT